MSAICPCCGRKLEDRPDPATLILSVRLGPQQRIVVDVLLRRFGAFVPGERLIGAVYGSRTDGGPDDANGGLSQRLFHLRRKLAPFGLMIESGGSTRGLLGYTEYRLCWRDAPLTPGNTPPRKGGGRRRAAPDARQVDLEEMILARRGGHDRPAGL